MRIIGLKKRIGQRIWPLVTAGVLLLSCSVARAEIFFIHNDHLGTPRAMTDKTGAVVWKAKYEPFGKATITKTPSAVTPIPPDLNLRFPGQYFDAETGLHYNYYRDYDPTTGRYLQPDPIGLAGEPNPYTYANNNPLRFTDPLGLAPGDRFDDPNSAGVDAACWCNPDSMSRNQEPAGSIYETDNGQWTYTEPNWGGGARSGPSTPPRGTPAWGFYHAHGAYDPGLGSGNYVFSPQDKRTSDFVGKPNYMANPRDEVQRYEPDPAKRQKGKVTKYGKCPR